MSAPISNDAPKASTPTGGAAGGTSSGGQGSGQGYGPGPGQGQGFGPGQFGGGGPGMPSWGPGQMGPQMGQPMGMGQMGYGQSPMGQGLMYPMGMGPNGMYGSQPQSVGTGTGGMPSPLDMMKRFTKPKPVPVAPTPPSSPTQDSPLVNQETDKVLRLMSVRLDDLQSFIVRTNQHVNTLAAQVDTLAQKVAELEKK